MKNHKKDGDFETGFKYQISPNSYTEINFKYKHQIRTQREKERENDF